MNAEAAGAAAGRRTVGAVSRAVGAAAAAIDDYDILVFIVVDSRGKRRRGRGSFSRIVRFGECNVGDHVPQMK